MEEKRFERGGSKAALVMWGAMVPCWLIDMLALNGNYILEAVTLILAPLVLFGCYLTECLRYDPDRAAVKAWHEHYAAVFCVCWGAGYVLSMLAIFFIHSENIRLSGIGMNMYGFSGLIGFLVAAWIFQKIRNAGKDT